MRNWSYLHIHRRKVRLSPDYSEAYLTIPFGLAPIPIYYLLVFLISGFREDK